MSDSLVNLNLKNLLASATEFNGHFKRTLTEFKQYQFDRNNRENELNTQKCKLLNDIVHLVNIVGSSNQIRTLVTINNRLQEINNCRKSQRGVIHGLFTLTDKIRRQCRQVIYYSCYILLMFSFNFFVPVIFYSEISH